MEYTHYEHLGLPLSADATTEDANFSLPPDTIDSKLIFSLSFSI